MFAPKPGLAFNEFPCNVQNCLKHNTNIDCNGVSGKESCDEIIGSYKLGYGFCYNNPENAYCACVNSIIPCPEKRNKYCTTLAYKPKKVNFCESNNICSNIVDSYGEKNTYDGIIQTCSNAKPISKPPYFQIFLIIIFVSIIIFAVLEIDAPILSNFVS